MGQGEVPGLDVLKELNAELIGGKEGRGELGGSFVRPPVGFDRTTGCLGGVRSLCRSHGSAGVGGARFCERVNHDGSTASWCLADRLHASLDGGAGCGRIKTPVGIDAEVLAARSTRMARRMPPRQQASGSSLLQLLRPWGHGRGWADPLDFAEDLGLGSGHVEQQPSSLLRLGPGRWSGIQILQSTGIRAAHLGESYADIGNSLRSGYPWRLRSSPRLSLAGP